MLLDYCAITNIYRISPFLNNPDLTATTINLIDDPNYALKNREWPVGAVWTDTTLRSTAYNDVVQPLAVTVRGQTAAAAMTLATRLVRVLDDAALWAQGKKIVPTIIRARAAGSETIYECAVLGLAERPTIPAPTLQIDGYALDLEMTIIRRARWLRRGFERFEDQADTSLCRSATAEIGQIANLPAFTGSIPTILEPLAVEVNQIDQESRFPYVMLIGRGIQAPSLSTRRAGLVRAAGYSSNAAAGWTTTIDTAAAAVGDPYVTGKIWRYTPTTTLPSLNYFAEFACDNFSSITSTYTPLVLVAFTARNNGSASYQVRVAVRDFQTQHVAYTPPIIVDNSTNVPRAFVAGLAAVQVAAGWVALEVTASATGGSLDIDAIYVLDYGDPGAAAIIIDSAPPNADTFINIQSPELFNVFRTVVCSSSDLTAVLPDALYAFRGGGSTGGIEYHQDGVLATILAPYGTKFRKNTNPLTWKIARRPASLLPGE